MLSLRSIAYLPVALLALSLWLLADSAANDFFQFWFAGHLVATGRSPYDQTAWYGAHATFGALAETVRVNCPRPDAAACLWTYPPWTAWLLLPFGALPVAAGLALEKAAFIVLLAAGAVASAAAAGIERHRARAGVAAGALGSAPFVRDALTGHFEGALLLGLVLLVGSIRRGSYLGLAVAALLLGTKAHLFLGLAVVVVALLVARRQLRLLVGSGVAVVAVAGAAVLAEPSFLAAVVGAPGKAGLSGSSTWAFAERGFDPLSMPVALLVIGATVLAAVAFVAETGGPRPWSIVAAGMAVSISIAPYVQSYDHVLLLPCLATGIARTPRPRWLAAALLLGGFAALSWWAYLLELGGSPLAFTALLPAVTLTISTAVPAISRSR